MTFSYENIPLIVIETIRTLYRSSYVDLRTAQAVGFFNLPDLKSVTQDATLILSQAAFVVSMLFGAFIVFVGIQRRMLRATLAAASASPASESAETPVPTGVLRERWSAVMAHLDSVREADWKLAVIEADKLVDDALAKAGFPGATFGDRLSNIPPDTLRSLDGIWWAHKVRNRLAHEVDYFLRYTEARQAVGYFEAALAELKLI